MADNFGVVITGARAVELAFDEEIPAEFRELLRGEIDAFTTELEGLILERIPRRTGRLASEVAKSLHEEPDHITGSVTVRGEFAKAGALEYGAHRGTRVSAHPMHLTQVFGQELRSPLTVFVAAYQRKPDIQEYRYERGPLEELTPEIEAGLQNAIAEGIRE